MSTTVGEFEILEQLGEGNFSVVRKARHIATGAIYAAKVIDREIDNDPDLLRRFKRELEVMAQLDHPGVIRLHAVLETPESYFLIVDLASGGDLAGLLERNGTVSEPVARGYFRQLIDAIAYMHSHNAVHRDLKPENLLFDENGTLKVGDFGFSIIPEDIGADPLYSRCGTPYYTAPEVFLADGYTGPPVDIWSSGVILYRMLTGKHPFEAATIAQLAVTIMRTRIRFPASLSQDAVDLLKRILIADPEKRCTIREIRAHPWFNEGYEVEKDVEAEEEPRDQFITVFELIARIMSPTSTINCFSGDVTVDEAIQRLNRAAESFRGKMRPEGEDMEFNMKCLVPRNDRIAIKCRILPIEENCVVVTMLRQGGTQSGFKQVFKKARKLMSQKV
jgi:5'-AMP-activated protein kinase catalytic alpha subunit